MDWTGGDGSKGAAYDVPSNTDVISPVDGKIDSVGRGYSPSTGATVRYFEIADEQGNSYRLHFLGRPLVDAGTVLVRGMRIAVIEYENITKISDVLPYPIALDRRGVDLMCSDLR
jgi:hypothetical protein